MDELADGLLEELALVVWRTLAIAGLDTSDDEARRLAPALAERAERFAILGAFDAASENLVEELFVGELAERRRRHTEASRYHGSMRADPFRMAPDAGTPRFLTGPHPGASWSIPCQGGGARPSVGGSWAAANTAAASSFRPLSHPAAQAIQAWPSPASRGRRPSLQ